MTAYPSRTVVNLQQSDGRSHSGTKELQLIRDLIDSDKATAAAPDPHDPCG